MYAFFNLQLSKLRDSEALEAAEKERQQKIAEENQFEKALSSYLLQKQIYDREMIFRLATVLSLTN